jgi:hypothetical protein
MEKSATLSPDGVYRYTLERVWAPSLPRVVWVMLNPSTADAEQDSPGIARRDTPCTFAAARPRFRPGQSCRCARAGCRIETKTDRTVREEGDHGF